MKKTSKVMIVLVVLLMTFSVVGITANAADYEDYAPILYFEGEETCFPIEAEYHIDNSVLSTAEFEGELIEYYDNIHGTVEDNGVIEHYQANKDLYDSVVYYRETIDADATVIQYWFFYAFNKGELNTHEGDWEMVQVVIPTTGTKWVAYSQHYSGQSATWNQVEKEGDHIKVYVSRGSHASFLRSYSGKLGFGMGSDIVGTNGRIMENGDYELRDLTAQDWFTFDGFWGEYGGDEDHFLGRAGTPGPDFRDPTEMFDNPVDWGRSLQPASDILFALEWFLYNLVTIYIAISIIILAFIFFKIYRRYKKYGLGPRIVSLFYIDGPNLHTIGNILCIVGIILAILGLFGNWYLVSANVDVGEIGTDEMIDVFSFGGNGLVINVPTSSGTMPVAALIIPFALFIGIGILFMIFSTIGVPKSGKLGWKYMGRGIRLIVPIILILIVVAAIGSVGLTSPAGDAGDTYITQIMSSISGYPMGGEVSIPVSESEVTGFIEMSWGLGSGALYLIIAAIIMIVGGILEFSARKTFFEPKVPIDKPKPVYEKPPTSKKQAIPATKPESKSKTDVKTNFCEHCGAKVKENQKFCPKCGEKI